MRSLVFIALAVALAAPSLARADAPKPPRETMRQVVFDRALGGVPAGLALVDLELSASIADLDPTGAAITIQWRRTVRAGRTSLLVEVRGPKGTLSRGWARLDIREVRRVLVASRPLQEGAGIAEGDLVLRDVPVERGQGWAMRAQELRGAPVLRDVAAGEVVGPDIVVAPPPVPRGTAVTVVVARGTVAVKAQGLLERAAMPGEQVPVRLLSHARLVHGVLVGRDEVQVGSASPR